jgi:hypothetical protein
LYRQDETFANFIKQSTQQREKRRNKERGPKSEPKEQTPKWVTMGAQKQIMFQNAPPPPCPLVTRSISEKEGDGKLEKEISLEEPSPAMTKKNPLLYLV